MPDSAKSVVLEKCHISFFDTHAIQPAVTNSNFYLQQVGEGPFYADLYSAHIGNGILDKGFYSKAVLSQGAINNEYMAFGCVLKSKKAGKLNGHPMQTNDIILADEGAALEYLSEDETEWTTLQFKREDLSHLGVRTEGNGQVYHIKGSQRTAFMLEKIFHKLENGEVTHLDNEMVYNYILSLYAKSITLPEDLKPIESKNLARQIYHYMNAHSHRTLQMIDLTTLTGKSERTLERVFKQHYGITPYRYLKLHRLNLIQKTLLDQRRGIKVQSISNIAMKNGFLQMGYFSAEYKKLFGETPSETLKRK